MRCRARDRCLKQHLLVAIMTVWVLAAANASDDLPQRMAPAAADAFLEALQHAFARDDRTAVAALVRYPMTVVAGGLAMPIRNAELLVKLYDTVFTPELRTAVELTGGLTATPSPQPYVMTRSSDSIGLGGGVLWAQPFGRELRVTRIFVPAASDTGPSPQHPQPVHVDRDARSAQFSGALLPYGIQSYRIQARRRQLLTVRASGFRGRVVVLLVRDQATGRVVEARAGDHSRLWVGPMLSGTPYRVDVVRIGRTGPSAVLYQLTIALR